MSAIRKGELPPDSFLARYVGAYTDCYSVRLAQPVAQSQFIEAFYTTRLFKLERWILSLLVSTPSTDLQAKALASGDIDRFAVWRVDDRSANQLLLADFTGRTRSWLMSQVHSDDPCCTWLYFGSAVVPKVDARSGKSSYGMTFHVLQPFHRLYSRALLRAAVSRLRQLGRASA